MNNDKNTQTENPIVIFDTNHGNFEVEIFLNEMPITANNFLKLVNEEFYDKVKFHRVIKNFMIQAGDPLSKSDDYKNRWGTGGPGYTIKDEFVENISNIRGTISMANSGPNSGGSQFFINVKNNSFLDFDKEPLQSKHPVFGKVIKGIDIVDNISNTKTGANDIPVKDVIINKIYIKES
ncbi:MAG: peptidylprolyl isomerase [Nanoarchaeota archaeon]